MCMYGRLCGGSVNQSTILVVRFIYLGNITLKSVIVMINYWNSVSRFTHCDVIQVRLTYSCQGHCDVKFDGSLSSWFGNWFTFFLNTMQAKIFLPNTFKTGSALPKDHPNIEVSEVRGRFNMSQLLSACPRDAHLLHSLSLIPIGLICMYGRLCGGSINQSAILVVHFIYFGTLI